MNILRALFNKVTYRTEFSDPDPVMGLVVVPGRWGARTVYDPRVPAYLHARRVRMLREGMDPVDRALLDADTVALLAAAARTVGPGVDRCRATEFRPGGEVGVHTLVTARDGS